MDSYGSTITSKEFFEIYVSHKQISIWVRQIVSILHSEESHLMPLAAQQVSQIERISTIAPAEEMIGVY